MALYSISGIGRAKKHKKTKVEKRAKVLAKKKKILAKIKKVGKVAIKYNPLVATARNAFLVLVSLNVFNLGKKLNMLLVKNPKKLLNFWKGLSGNFASLQKSINSGKNKKAIIGVVAVTSAIATATPILIKVMKFLEENGINKDDLKKAVNVVVAKVIDKKITKEALDEVEEEEAKEEENTLEETPEETPEGNNGNEEVGSIC